MNFYQLTLRGISITVLMNQFISVHFTVFFFLFFSVGGPIELMIRERKKKERGRKRSLIDVQLCEIVPLMLLVLFISVEFLLGGAYSLSKKKKKRNYFTRGYIRNGGEANKISLIINTRE